MSLRQTGLLQDSSGRQAEEKVLDVIYDLFGKDYTRIFVNKNIPNELKTPDFVIPVFDSEGKFKFIIVECKAAPATNVDGSTKHSDTFQQIQKYKEIIENAFKKQNKKCEIECFVVHPNAKSIKPHLSSGRDKVVWMTLNEFRERLKRFKAVRPSDSEYEMVQIVYSMSEILQKYRSKMAFSDEQNKIVNWSFGGVKKIGGLAGTGKSLLLAKKLVGDIKNSNSSEFLYLTHNKNLILKFQDYLTTFLEEEGIEIVAMNKSKSFIITCRYKEKLVKLHLCHFDVFSTCYITGKMDLALFRKAYKGPLYQKSIECRESSQHDDEAFRNEREQLTSMLQAHELSQSGLFQMFDAMYIDEFQDCRIDPSRLIFARMFVKRDQKGELNLTFSEDTLQSYVKYHVLQEIDDSFENINKKDLASYEKLGLPPGLHGRSIILDTIYRTPENIFKCALNLLENQGGLLKKDLKKIKSLKYKNNQGRWHYIDEDQISNSILEMMNVNQRFPHEIIIIESVKTERTLKVSNRLVSKIHVHRVGTNHPPEKQVINIFHEFNVRGLEAKVVYLVVDDEIISHPNYVYTLMCRTQIELVLVKTKSLTEDKFKEFLRLLSETSWNEAA